MKRIWKAEEWLNGDRWYVNCTLDLCGNAGKWWIPCRILDLSPAQFIRLLLDEFHVDNISYSKDTLIYSWNEKNYSNAHKWLLYINRIAKKKNVTI